MEDMSWSYIAGFFDGEGCINKPKPEADRKRRMPRITIAQSQKQHQVLYVIQDFLAQQGVVCSIYTGYRPKNTHDNIPVSRLEIHSYCGVRKFLESVLPYLIVKWLRAKEVLGYIDAQHWGDHEFKPETIKRLKTWMTQELKQKWQDPEYKKEMAAVVSRAWSDPAKREIRLAKMKAAWTPAKRLERSERMKAIWNVKRGVVLP